jgi:hypothetical protein
LGGIKCRVVEGATSLARDGAGEQCLSGNSYWLQDGVGDSGEALFGNGVGCWVLDSVGCWVQDDGEEASGTASAVGSTENRTPAIAGVLERRDTTKKASRSDESERCDVRNGGGNPRRSHLLYPRSQLHRPGQAPEPILHELI